MRIRGYWWLDCPLATFLEEGSRSLGGTSGREPCTGRVFRSTGERLDDEALFTVQINAVM
jgi:hypothetical protein